MKVLDVAFKDLKRVFHSAFALVMMFGAPLLIAGLLYFAFGGLASGAGSFDLPLTRVVVANLDKGGAPSGAFEAGEMLVKFLQDEDLADVLVVTRMPDEAGARAAVDSRQAGVALIIPPAFTQAALAGGQEAAVTLYQDPTLTIGPGIVKDLVNHFMDGFSGARIAASVTDVRLRSGGVQPDPGLVQGATLQYAAYLNSSSHAAAFEVVSPSGQEPGPESGSAMIGPIMASMLIFFVFFMGANGAGSIVREHEEGTLARLFVTPASRLTILAGKFVGVFVTLLIQTAVLLMASALLFHISWGRPLSVGLVTLALILVATGFGVMLMSFVKNSRQTGPVLGGVMTLTGMLGGLFTNGIPNIPPALEKASLSMPQGWALQAWKLSLAGSPAGEILFPALVLVAMGMVFFAIGLVLFRKRFA